jgi:hypothetical protein
MDQLIHLIEDLHLSLIVAAVGALAWRAHAIDVVARAADGIVELGLADLAGQARSAVLRRRPCRGLEN